MFLLLADVFEQLKNFESLKNFGSCPSHYLNAPGLSWDVVLKITKIEPELAADPDRFIFFEKCTEGGISNRCSKANNKYYKSYE